MDASPSQPEAPPAAAAARRPSPGAAELLRLIRYAGPALYSQAGLHAQLLELEWAQEKQRLLGLLLAALLGYAALLTALLSTTGLLLALSWSTPYRLAVALGLVTANGLLLAWACLRLGQLVARGRHSFAASREELAADLALLRSGS